MTLKGCKTITSKVMIKNVILQQQKMVEKVTHSCKKTLRIFFLDIFFLHKGLYLSYILLKFGNVLPRSNCTLLCSEKTTPMAHPITGREPS